MRARRLEAELLDTLPSDDLRAIASRRDLVRINRAMRQGALMARQLRGFKPPRRLLDLGSGDGRFLLGVARRLGSRWAGVTAVIADQHDIVSDGTRHAFQHLGWRCEVYQGDVFDTLERLDGDGTLVTANLFLHHLDDESLARLFALAVSRAHGLVACEPRRGCFALAASRMVFMLGCNHVTRHDAVASVRAGFAGRELAALWPDRIGWTLEEWPAFPFSHCFTARRHAV
jgi:hypothetical protein